MNTFKIICAVIGNVFTQIFLLPWTIAEAVRRKRLQAVHNEHEVERLDRIRNPSKYLGK
jgi:hypothetical protein